MDSNRVPAAAVGMSVLCGIALWKLLLDAKAPASPSGAQQGSADIWLAEEAPAELCNTGSSTVHTGGLFRGTKKDSWLYQEKI